MREKLAIAKKLRSSRKISNNTENKKICSKCYRTYVVECIIKGKNEFKITFDGNYIQNFSERVSNWYHYVLNSIYRFYLVRVTPNDDKTFQKYELIHHVVSKPIHLKIANTPNEVILEGFLKENGFKIVAEHLYSESTVYDVVRI
jgi:hypothetical protein